MKFRTKILLCMVWILSLAVGIGGTMLISLSFRNSVDREKESLLQSYRMAAAVIGVTLENAGETPMETAAAEAFSQAQSVMDWSYSELSLDGAELCSAGTVLAPEPKALAANQVELRVFEMAGILDTGHYIQLCAGIQVDDSRLTLTLVRDITEVYETRETMLAAFRYVFLVTIALGGLVSFLLAAALTRPLGRMSRAARQMAEGDLSVRLRAESKDEIGSLARDFDHMADNLEENIHAMEETMAAQERFMGSFAHELKTPMTSIIGYADLLRTQALDPGDAQEAANYIFSEGKRLESLSLKLLQLHLAKHETPDLQTVEVSELAERLVRRLKPVYEQENVRLSCRTVPGKWEMDPELMESVLMNLMDNARKAMDKGGAILLMVEFPGETCRIRVCDNGRGMPPEVLSHLTEAFYRVDKSRSRAQGGAGLGLSLCNEIVRFHNGELKFDSQLGKGTCATVTLRRAEP